MISKNSGLVLPKILLPNDFINYEKWTVVACDQFSSEKKYWDNVTEFVGDAPSTLKITFPEAYLKDRDKKETIKNINSTIDEYLNNNCFKNIGESFIYIERTFSNKSKKARKGIIVALDLEKYDFSKKSKSIIRATEETIQERIPPRVEIRENAKVETPHILILINDKEKSIIEPIENVKDSLDCLYDFDLMFNQGHITGRKVSNANLIKNVFDNVEKLLKKCNSKNPILFAVGDGNHSLATAKTIWETTKKGLSKKEQENHPARFALVEINNIYDDGIEFMPINRVLFNSDLDKFIKFIDKEYNVTIEEKKLSTKELEEFELSTNNNQKFYIFNDKKSYMIKFNKSDATITTGTLQPILDKFIKKTDAEIDYIHGVESTIEVAQEKNSFGIILPNFPKEMFFETVLKDGSFPRKTFSMGEATEKRFYLEARKITK